MIKNNVEHGTCIVPKMVIFGHGSVIVSHVIFGDNTGACLLVDRSKNPGVVGEVSDEYKGMMTDEMGIDTMLVFDNVEGLDVLIEALSITREKMVELKKTK